MHKSFQYASIGCVNSGNKTVNNGKLKLTKVYNESHRKKIKLLKRFEVHVSVFLKQNLYCSRYSQETSLRRIES